MEINERYIKISRVKMIIEKGLEQDQDVTVIIKGAVTKREFESNQDGTENAIWIIKPYTAEIQ